jgi:hypothetical protein
MQMLSTPLPDPFIATSATDPAAWVRACTSNVELATAAAELVYGCFRTIAGQQSALATRVMTLATNGGGAMARPIHPGQATKLSYQSCEMVIDSLVEALEAIRQATVDIRRLVLHETEAPSNTTHG